MHLPWTCDDRCILCLERRPLTEEHLIPASLGGTLSVDFLCKPCNDRLGHRVEAGIKNDPRFRLAADRITDQAPEFARSFVDGQSYVANGGAGPVRLDVKGGRVQVRARKNPDGSLIQPTEAGRSLLVRDLRDRGESEEAIAASVAAFDSAPEEVHLTLAPGLSVIKRRIEKIEHDLSGDFAPRELFLKVAYEAFAFCFGRDVYDFDGAAEVRSGIEVRDKNQTPLAYADPSGSYGVESWMTHGAAQPIHGIAVGGNNKHVVVRICLFGTLLFDVHFLKVTPRPPFAMITQSLVDGAVDVQEIEKFPISGESIF